MASSQRPRMSLPPELSSIDEGWGEEEQTTLPRPSRMPTAPVREQPPDVIVTAPPPTGIELESFDDDPSERATTAPKVPLDDYARAMMAIDRHSSAAGASFGNRAFTNNAITQAPPPPSEAPEYDAAEFRLDLYTSFPENEKPTAPHLSQMPTAPPPVGFDPDRARTSPERGVIRGELFDSRVSHEEPSMELDLASELPPPITPQSSSPGYGSAGSSGVRSHQMMKDRFAMGDFSGALEVADQILSRSPQDPEARSLADKCREVLLDMYSSRINGLEKVPHIAMTPDQIRWLSLDHRAGFMLSMIDGISSIDDLLDVSGMQRLDALRILCSLLDQKVIHLT